MLEIGTMIDGKYKVLNKIGQGGMSSVYLAMNEKANKQWAIKEVRRVPGRDFELIKNSLRAEIELLKKLNHPNIPTIVDVIETDGKFLIVMDYIEGITLRKAMEERGKISQEDVVDWAKQLCIVLEYLHSRTPAIIYRDTKPSNIMLKPDGTIMLIDFGTAREFKEDTMNDTVCLGTHNYAAPEQFGGQGQTDARTDIFNLGATMYHLLTNKCVNLMSEEEISFHGEETSISSGLKYIIKKCLKYRPEDRYQTCSQILYALNHIEEMNEQYRKGQKRRLFRFCACLLLAITSFSSSLYLDHVAASTTNADYNETLLLAEKVAGNVERCKLFEDAIQIDPGRGEAYRKLIQEYYSDLDFSKEEEERFRQLLQTVGNGKSKPNVKYLMEYSEDYGEFAFELGTAYWYYFYAPESKKKNATMWFKDAINYGTLTRDKEAKAQLFYDIGNFHKNILLHQEMGDDAGKYREYWEKLKLLQEEFESVDTSEALLLQLYREMNNQANEYRIYFCNDGVEKSNILDTLQSIKMSMEKFKDIVYIREKEIKGLFREIEDTMVLVEIAFQKK